MNWRAGHPGSPFFLGATTVTAKQFGYARVSTTDQDLTIQRDALVKAGVPEPLIFAEQVSGTSTKGRDELSRVLAILGKGDSLVVTRLDRLGRSMRDLANIAHELDQKGAHLRVIEQSVDTSTTAGRAFFGMLAVFAEFETGVRRERQLEGIEKAKAEGGKYIGRKPSVDRAKVLELKSIGMGPTAIARQLGCDPSTVHRLLAA